MQNVVFSEVIKLLTKNCLNVVCFFIIGLFFNFETATAENSELMEFSLEELMNVDIASNVERPITEQPSIISVITRDEIFYAGARDLVDVLRMVPGFHFAHDVVGIHSWAFRGLWSQEGKALLIIDGVVFNDPTWGNVAFFRRFPADLIKQVEVIRGPGAAKYGNYAEAAVVKVTTLDHKLHGNFANQSTSFSDKGLAHANIALATGNEKSNGFRYSLNAFYQEGNRSTEDLVSNDKLTVVKTANNSDFDSAFFKASLGYKSFDATVLLHQHRYVFQDDLNSPAPLPNTKLRHGYPTTDLGLKYTRDLGEKFTLKLRTNFQEVVAHDQEVLESDTFTVGESYKILSQRIMSVAEGVYKFSENANLALGVEYIDVEATSKAVGDFFLGSSFIGSRLEDTYFNGDNSMQFNQDSYYFQYENYNSFLNITLGGRYAKHSKSTDTVFVPRVGVFKKFGLLGVKLMYNKAFRMGDVEHIHLASSGNLKAEELEAYEGEFSYSLSNNSQLTVNVFSMRIDDPIVYVTQNSVGNFGELASEGVELVWSYQQNSTLQSNFTWSFYQGKKDSVASYLSKNESAYLGIPQHKITWNLLYKLNEKWKVNPSIFYEGEKYRRTNDLDTSLDEALNPSTLLNLFAVYQMKDSLNLSFGIHNIFNVDYKFPKAYDALTYPADSREYHARLSYFF